MTLSAILQSVMGKQYRSDARAAVHETALCLAEAGVMDKRTMKAFDEMCLTPVKELTAEQIRQIRLREKASQAVFARYLNVTTGLVSQWERGEKHPRGASLKLLTLVAKRGLRAVA
jgi:putative transcriptional regulator